MSRDILEKRLQKEAERLGVTVEDARDRMLTLGLDAAKLQRDKESIARDLSVDILLVTATITEHQQLREVARALGFRFDKRSGRLGMSYYHLGQIADNRVASIQVQMGAFGSDGAAARCIEARAETHATTLILMGTAFGVNPRRQRVGDVLVSESVFLYDDRRVVDAEDADTSGAPLEECHQILSDPRSNQSIMARRIRETLGPGYALRYPPSARKMASTTWVERFRQTAAEFERTGASERVMVGTLLSGGAHIESAYFRDELVRGIPATDSPIIGGEMEAVGAVSASARGDNDDPGWIVVKGIVDFADALSRQTDKVAENREIAAHSSASVVLRTIQTHATLM